MIMAATSFFLFLVVADALVVLAMADLNSPSFPNPPTPSPNIDARMTSSTSTGSSLHLRKFGRHQSSSEIPFNYVAPSSSPSPSPLAEVPHNSEESSSYASTETAALSSDQSSETVVQEFHLTKRHHVDKSVAGGGVILGGLATTFLVAVFCYIRATGRHKTETAV